MQTTIPPLPQTSPSSPFESRPRKKRSPLPGRRKRFSLFALVSGAVTLMIILGAATYFVVLPRLQSHAANVQPDMNCTLIVPANPLSAQGLATPYQFLATNPKQGPCNESNAGQSAFVQGVIYDPATGKFSVYNPLVIDKGTKPAITPRVPVLPKGAIVGLWFGFNATNLQLQGKQEDTLARAHCANGIGHSLFGQFAYCNAPAVFAAANQGIVAHRVNVPPLQMAKDGLPCPTVRDFGMIDQDQSDNVQTRYLSTSDGRTAQFSAANQARLHNATAIANPSDNALLTNFIDPALGCQPWTAPDLANANNPVPALVLDELQASLYQRAPVALVPMNDPMVTIADGNNNNPSLFKTNLYRQGVDQIPATKEQQASGTTYCSNFLHTGLPRLELDQPLTIHAQTPAADMANSLFTFLAQRFQASYTNLNCAQLLGVPNPVKTQTNNNGVVIGAKFNNQAIGQLQSPTAHNSQLPTAPAVTHKLLTPTTPVVTNNMPVPTIPATGSATAPTTTPLNCSVNGTLIHNCQGTVTINGQTCVLSYINNTVNIDCPNT